MYTCTRMKQETNEELHVQGTYKVTDGPKECSVIPYKKKQFKVQFNKHTKGQTKETTPLNRIELVMAIDKLLLTWIMSPADLEEYCCLV